MLAVVGLMGRAWASPPNANKEASIGRLGPALAEEAELVAIATLVICCFAVLTRQATIAYRQNLRVSFGLFLILFLGTVFDVFIPTDGLLALLAHLAIDSYMAKFAVIFLASVLSGGVLVFWAKGILYLLPMIAGASLVALLASLKFRTLQDIPVLLFVTAGIAGGLWHYWWRDCRRKREAPADGKGNKAGAAGLNTGSGCSN